VKKGIFSSLHLPLSLLASIMLVAALFVVTAFILLQNRAGDLPDIVLPSSSPPLSTIAPDRTPGVNDTAAPLPTSSDLMAGKVEIDRTNAGQVLKAMPKQSGYSAVWQVEWYWEGGSSGALERHIYGKDGYLRSEVYDSDGVLLQNQVTGNGNAFLWTPSGPYHATVVGGVSAENEAGIATYDRLLTYTPDEILSAEYLVWEGAPCLYVESKQSGSVYVDSWWISLENGCLVRMEKTLDGILKYSCVLQTVTLTSPADELFRLPDKRLAMDVIKVP
jgi:hypothetical protein